jgi:hypothetical protein
MLHSISRDQTEHMVTELSGPLHLLRLTIQSHGVVHALLSCIKNNNESRWHGLQSLHVLTCTSVTTKSCIVRHVHDMSTLGLF